jgi:hypothetical protein
MDRMITIKSGRQLTMRGAHRKGKAMLKRSRNVGTRRSKGLTSASLMAMTVVAGVVVGIGVPVGTAGASTLFGQGTEVTPLSGMTFSQLQSISCTSSGNCTAVGTYRDASNYGQAMAITESGGTWGALQELIPPSNAYMDPSADLGGVSCTSPGNCVAVGSYESLPAQHPLEAVETNGIWSQMTELPLPSNADTYNALLFAVSCPSAGNCVATGEYGYSSGTTTGPFIDQETNGSWSATQLTPPGGSTFTGGTAVSCSGTTANCTVAGFVTNGSTRDSFAATESNGSWGAPANITLPSNATGGSSLNGVSCPSAGSCVAVGSYNTSSGFPPTSVPMQVTATQGTWANATTLPLPSNAQYLGRQRLPIYD